MAFRRLNGGLPLNQLRDEMDRLMEDFFGPASRLHRTQTTNRGFPAMNLWESGDSLVAEAEVPGMKSEDLDISVVGNELTIRGHRQPCGEEGAAYHRRERGLGEFSRSVRLPIDVDGSKVSAELRDGVLRITLPKAEAAKPRKIEVKASN